MEKSKNRALSFFAWSLIIVSALSGTLQAESTIDPCLFETCECSWYIENVAINIECENEDKSQATPNYFPARNAAATSLPVNYFLIHNYDFKSIPDKAFDGLTVNSFISENNGLQKLTTNAFDGIKDMRFISLVQETSLQTIDPNAFDPASNLTTLELENCNMDDASFASFLPAMSKLKKLARLQLAKNRLRKLDSTSFKDLRSLSQLVVSGNQIFQIDPDTFSQNTQLNLLDAEENALQTFDQVFKALNKSGPIVTVNLGGNSFNRLTTNAAIPSLTVLRITNGLIEAFDSQSLVGTNGLKGLYLSNNKINRIDDSRIQQLVSLEDLKLSRNFLSRVPSISKNRFIRSLDLSWQNDLLTAIPNYAFEREQVPFNLLEIDLSENDIQTFGQKAFCSRNYQPAFISSVKFSYDTMKTIPKCVLKQLSYKPNQGTIQVEVSKPDMTTSDYSQVCNCDLLSFSLLYGLDVTGVCQDVFPGLQCNTEGYLDPCVGQTQFDCDSSDTTMSTTTSTNAPAPVSTTTRAATTSSGLKNLSSSFITITLLAISVVRY